MYGQADPPQCWSVHAELTISHPTAKDPDNLPQIHTAQTENSVHMTCSWSPATQKSPPFSSSHTPPPDTISPESDTAKLCNFQRGNIYFTSTPPKRSSNFIENHLNVSYGREESSKYLGPCLTPKCSIPSYSGQCRSTCNIILSDDVNDTNNSVEIAHGHTKCRRTQSLRCQMLNPHVHGKGIFYGCGDPWCHHLHSGGDLSNTGIVPPVMKINENRLGEEAFINSSKASNFAQFDEHVGTHFLREIKTRDVSVQTSEMIDKSTSPFLKVDHDNNRHFGTSMEVMSRPTEEIFQKPHWAFSIKSDKHGYVQVRLYFKEN